MSVIVLTSGGREVDLDAYAGATVGALADAIASDSYHDGQPLADGHRFSFKVDGVVLDPGVTPSFSEGQTVELVDVTDGIHVAGDGVEKAGIEVPLGETGTLVQDDEHDADHDDDE